MIMDYSILIVLGVLLGVILTTIGIKYAQRKGIFTNEDLLKVIKTFDLSMAFIKELKLNKEPEILQIADIVNDALEMALALGKTKDIKEIEKIVIEKVNETCVRFTITITPDREMLINELVKIGLENKFVKTINE
jgi:hypothetical protein